MASIASVDMSEMSSRITLRITGFRVFRIRWAIAAQVFRLGALIAGCRATIEVEAI